MILKIYENGKFNQEGFRKALQAYIPTGAEIVKNVTDTVTLCASEIGLNTSVGSCSNYSSLYDCYDNALIKVRL